MNDLNPKNVIYQTKATLDFEKVDIFLRVKGRLPNKKGDGLTKDVLIEYCDRYIKGDLTKGIVSLYYMYKLAQRFLLEEHGYNYYKICDEKHNKSKGKRYKEDILPYIPKVKKN